MNGVKPECRTDGLLLESMALAKTPALCHEVSLRTSASSTNESSPVAMGIADEDTANELQRTLTRRRTCSDHVQDCFAAL